MLVNALKNTSAMVAIVSLTACTAPPPPQVTHPAHAIGVGLGYVVASPLLILVGLVEGIAAVPYFLDADLHEMNNTMVASKSRVNLDRTYRSAYRTSIDRVAPDGDTGQIFRHMREATHHFRSVLRGYGVADADRYVLTAVRTADRDGFTLYAVVHRPTDRIRVKTRSGVKTLTSADDDFFRPYSRDASGRSLDVVIDWAGVPRTSIRTQKGQAILMTLAANSVLINRRSDEYWGIEQRWIRGDYRRVVNERKVVLDRRMA